MSIHSATKYISGHSDVMGGFAICSNAELADEMRAVRFFGGAIMDPNSAWLLRRSAQTLALRMRCHVEIVSEMREFLSVQPEVGHVYFPKVDGRQLLQYGGILFFDLRADLANQYEAFRDALALFGSGTGMAAVTSMVAQPYTGSHASLDETEKARMGLGRQLVRLCFGLEDSRDLKADIRQALSTAAARGTDVSSAEVRLTRRIHGTGELR